MKINLNALQKTKVKPFCRSGITKEEYDNFVNESGDMFPFVLTDDWLCIITSETKDKEKRYFITSISSEFTVSKCNYNIVTNIQSYTICAKVNGDEIEFEVNAETLTAFGLKELLKRGVLYDERMAKELQRYIVISAYNAEKQAVHTTLGWNGQLFLSSNSYPDTKHPSKYIGGIDFCPKGSKEIYLDMIKSQVVKYIPLLFIWIVGFCSIILVESVLTKNGYESIKTLTEKWQDNKLLLCEKDRAYKRVKLSKDLPPQPCYVFRLSTDSSEHITVKPDFESVSSDKLDDVDIRF